MSVFSKLQAVREEFAKMDLKKSGKNDFSKYTYFELSDFLPIAQVKFKEAGLCPITNFPEENKGTLTIYDAENPAEYIVFHSPMAVPNVKGMNEAQAVGAAQTYARRYLYQTALELSEHDPIEDPSAIAEIARLKSDITDLGSRITDIDKTNKTKVADIIRTVYGSTKYKDMKPGDEAAANKIIDELRKLENELKGNKEE